MAETLAARGIAPAFSLTAKIKFALGNVRVIVIGSLFVISGCLASAALIQMRLDRQHALAQASVFETARTADLAHEISAALDRYAAIADAFGADALDADASAALADAGGAALRNVVVLDADGRLISEMMGTPKGLLPVSAQMLAAAREHRVLFPSGDGRTLGLAVAASGHIAIVQIDPAILIADAPDALIALPSGETMALGKNWAAPPGLAEVRAAIGAGGPRLLSARDGTRLIVLAKVGDWPLVAAQSVAESDALDAWYGALPLYLFIILGPALAGAGLAAVFVREFERRVRAAQAVRSLRATRQDEARLLVRLADAERRAVTAERAKAEFMAHMSHELRTPLNAIIGFAEAMADGTLGQTQNADVPTYARNIATAGHQLHARIGDILDFADIDARRRTLSAEPVDMIAFLREALERIRTDVRASGVKVLVGLPGEARALADPFGVQRIYDSILTNAVKFTPKGGEIRVSLRVLDDTLLVTVADTGMGFPRQEANRADADSRRFERASPASGLGLGLAIATTLARRMNGSLKVTSRHGEGTTAELRLPGIRSQKSEAGSQTEDVGTPPPPSSDF